MPNTIALAKNYTNILDEVYQSVSVTADLTSDSSMMQAGANANEIIYPQISVTGLGDYDRNSGYTQGAVNLEWVTAKFNYDRGTKIAVDVMDNEESRNIAFTMAGAELQRTKVAPEADAFTFATFAGVEGISKATPATYANATEFLTALIEAKNKMDEDEVPEENRYLYATPTLLNGVMALDTTKSREILNAFAVKKGVPQTRFYTAIDLLDGRTAGEELGHFKKNAEAKDINFMIVHKPAIIKFDKHTASDIIPAASNPDADADISKYRKYGLVDVYKNKAAGIYISHKA
ncbi:hypothetical protein OBO34_21260 [Clostridiales Family XIII bacterium ASD5510]|uniref:Uncharacterized protein n=2 Tax=Bacteria TaxID=2 RepID=A0A9J6QZ91_9FIRM|nr:hypothetical protein [Hominibacterium faecale]MCU7380846.1 hypothetical protein [Hominibacterium faecale]